MNLNKNKLKNEIIKLIDKSYTGKIEDMGFITFQPIRTNIEKQFRLQFDNMLTYEGYSVCLKNIEHSFFSIISDD